ncbi:MAG: hypothetical protein MJ108_08220 [Saccharofermentans sp.]|nr:hypothetical protein [Saccharofermentans sp.]
MSNKILENHIMDIQVQYLDLLYLLLPMLEDDAYRYVAQDCISAFWRKNKHIIDLYLKYIVKEKNAVFYTAATFFDVDNGEHYPFLLMGDIHIFDDPLAKYSELCCMDNVPESYMNLVPTCAKDNIKILEQLNDEILILPLRFLGSKSEEEDFCSVTEKFFLSFFKDIPDIDTYFKRCKTEQNIIDNFNYKHIDSICLYDGDNGNLPFDKRLKIAFDEAKRIMGDGHTAGDYFYCMLYGPLQQALDILMTVGVTGAIPLIRYSVALHNVLMLLPNFDFGNNKEVRNRLLIFNAAYRFFDTDRVKHLSTKEFVIKIKKFNFENRAIECFNDEKDLDSIKSLTNLVDELLKTILDNK